VADSSNHNNESLDSTEGGEVVVLKKCLLLKKDCAPWSVVSVLLLAVSVS
jgi:hypothetical protein